MKYQKNADGKKMTKFDMASAMLMCDHTNAPHDYSYYNVQYQCQDIISYEEMAEMYRECFNL